MLLTHLSSGLPKLLLTDLTFIFALHAGKQLLLSQSISPTLLLSRVLAYGSGLAFVWCFAVGKLKDAATIKVLSTTHDLSPYSTKSFQPSIWGLSSLVFYSRNVALLFALSKLPSSRCVLSFADRSPPFSYSQCSVVFITQHSALLCQSLAGSMSVSPLS